MVDNGKSELLNHPQVFSDEDMAEGRYYQVGPGSVGLFSSRCPGKESANEDSAILFPYDDQSCVLAVADGVGGARAGNQASQNALKALISSLEKAKKDGLDVRNAIIDGFEAANKKVLDLGIGAATTLAVVDIQGRHIRPYHVGDSLILAVGQKGKIKLQTISHSPVGYGVQAGFLDQEEAMEHEDRHLVSNLIGSKDMHIAIGPICELAAKDSLLLTTDGMSDNLLVDEIVEFLRKGPIDEALDVLASTCRDRMETQKEEIPSKPDDLTFILYRS